MDFSLTADDEAFRDELRAWLDTNLPKFLVDWGADDQAGGSPRRPLTATGSPAPRNAARTGSAG